VKKNDDSEVEDKPKSILSVPKKDRAQSSNEINIISDKSATQLLGTFTSVVPTENNTEHNTE